MKAQIYIEGVCPMTLEEENGALIRVDFGNKPEEGISLKKTELLSQAERQLEEYFQGKRKIFELPLRYGGTEFQRQVWEALLTIPYGETVSYQEIARRVGRERAVRAVGTAIGRNPLGIVIPCHRVIGKDGGLHGFGGGLENKKMLLELEERWR